MAYTAATVITADRNSDGQLHLVIRYTGPGEDPRELPFDINIATPPPPGLVRAEAIRQIARLNNTAVVGSALVLPLALDVTTPLPGPPASPFGSYVAVSAPFAPGAVPQDVFTIIGSSTKTVTVLGTSLSTVQNIAGLNNWRLVRRSTDNSGGTSNVVAAIPVVTTYPSPTAVVRSYTANPTAGVLVGTVWEGRIAAPLVSTAATGFEQTVAMTGAIPAPIAVLVGPTEVLSWNFKGAASPAGLSVIASVWWTES